MQLGCTETTRIIILGMFVLEPKLTVYTYGMIVFMYSDAMINYMNALEELGIRVLAMLANGLGLDSNFFTRHFLSERESTMIRVNRYPPCPLPNRCLGLGSHSDPHTLTILLQDEVGGLQVCDDHNRWFGIRPLPKSFVVNIGDTLEVRL